MNHLEYSRHFHALLQQQPATLPPIVVDDTRRNNAGRCMAALLCNRLGQGGEAPEHVRHTTFNWSGGTFALRNSRISDHFWSNSPINVADKLHELASEHAVAYLLVHWALDDALLHAWVVPEDVAFESFAELPVNANYPSKTIELSAHDHQLKNAPSAPSFEPYYLHSALTAGEIEKLQEAIKTDDLIKQERLAAEPVEDEPVADVDGADDAETTDDWSGDVGPGYTVETAGCIACPFRSYEDLFELL